METRKLIELLRATIEPAQRQQAEEMLGQVRENMCSNDMNPKKQTLSTNLHVSNERATCFPSKCISNGYFALTYTILCHYPRMTVKHLMYNACSNLVRRFYCLCYFQLPLYDFSPRKNLSLTRLLTILRL